MSARSLLARVRRLEAGKTSHILKIIGSIESFEERITVLVSSGQMCPIDGPVIAQCVRRWVTEDVRYYAGTAGNARS